MSPLECWCHVMAKRACWEFLGLIVTFSINSACGPRQAIPSQLQLQCGLILILQGCCKNYLKKLKGYFFVKYQLPNSEQKQHCTNAKLYCSFFCSKMKWEDLWEIDSMWQVIGVQHPLVLKSHLREPDEHMYWLLPGPIRTYIKERIYYCFNRSNPLYLSSKTTSRTERTVLLGRNNNVYYFCGPSTNLHISLSHTHTQQQQQHQQHHKDCMRFHPCHPFSFLPYFVRFSC